MYSNFQSHVCRSYIYEVTYRIARNFDGGNFDGFDAFRPDRQKLTRQILKAIQCLVKDTNHLSKYFPLNIWKVSIRQNPPRQISRYTVVYVINSACLLVILCLITE